jgi:hypothetical protein
MPSYVVKLPVQIDGKTIDWTGARFHDLSVWGGGRGAKDVWGWGGSGECSRENRIRKCPFSGSAWDKFQLAPTAYLFSLVYRCSLRRLRTAPTNPVTPVPRSNSVAGSGVATVIM